MREALFIKKNAEKWTEYQQQPSTDPDEQAERFITLLDDLSYSRTFYPQSKVTKWINGIAVGTYQSIYQNKKEKFNRLITFWTTELPLLFRRHHKTLLFVTVFFVACVIIGYLTSKYDKNFVSSILGPEYVSETEERIAKGDPFGIYRDDDKFNMFMRIAVNNIRVSFMCFAGGLIFWLVIPPFWWFSTIYMLLFNGIMIGAFEEMFFAHGLGWQSILVIWVHGTIEIWSIVIAGTAGMIMGLSYIVPGNFKRKDSFKRGVKDACKIILALIPFFIFAAFLESYVTYLMSNTFDKTNNVGLPIWVSILILTASFLFIVWYFVILPIKLERKQKMALAFTDKPVLFTKQ